MGRRSWPVLRAPGALLRGAGPIVALSVSPDGRVGVALDSVGGSWVVELVSGASAFPGPGGARAMATSSAFALLLVDDALVMFHLAAAREAQRHAGFRGARWLVVGELGALVAVGWDDHVELRRIATGRLVARLEAPVAAAAFGRHDLELLLGEGDGLVGRAVPSLERRWEQPTSGHVAEVASGGWFVDSSGVRRWDGEQLGPAQAPWPRVTANGDGAVAWGPRGIWTLADGCLHPVDATAVAAHPDGRHALVGDQDGEVRLIRLSEPAV